MASVACEGVRYWTVRDIADECGVSADHVHYYSETRGIRPAVRHIKFKLFDEDGMRRLCEVIRTRPGPAYPRYPVQRPKA